MTKDEICHVIKSYLLEGHGVILTGCHGIGKKTFVCSTFPETEKLFGKSFLNVSSWKRDDFYRNIMNNQMNFSEVIFCIPDLFRLEDWFSLINLLFDHHILFLASSDFLIPLDNPEYSSIAGRFKEINVGSLDYRDWKKDNMVLPYSSFCLNDYPNYIKDETLLTIIKNGLPNSKDPEKLGANLLATLKLILKCRGTGLSLNSLSKRAGYSVNTIAGYRKELINRNLLYPIKRENLNKKDNVNPKSIFYPAYNSFYQFSESDLAEKANIETIYVSKLISKLLSYCYQVSSGYLYSTMPGVKNRYQECGLVLKKDKRVIYRQYGETYDEIRAKPLLAIKNGNPKYYALLSGQEMQILDNGIRLIGIDRLIKGDLKELE